MAGSLVSSSGLAADPAKIKQAAGPEAEKGEAGVTLVSFLPCMGVSERSSGERGAVNK
ncbi:hypothetical protein [Bradyrhizobium sp. 2TAF24]|uniref:hypothetical protein n=1 Tax=Bradyrhizobium sp. 2TAF24 TaxID=3233011 RepID=UPI003F8E6E1E